MKSPRTRSISAFNLTELLVTIACVLLVVAIFLPALGKAKARSSKLGCTNCLKQIGLGFRGWAIDNNERFPMRVSVTIGGTMELVRKSGLLLLSSKRPINWEETRKAMDEFP